MCLGKCLCLGYGFRGRGAWEVCWECHNHKLGKDCQGLCATNGDFSSRYPGVDILTAGRMRLAFRWYPVEGHGDGIHPVGTHSWEEDVVREPEGTDPRDDDLLLCRDVGVYTCRRGIESGQGCGE